VEPWNSLLEPASGWIKLGPNLGRDYRFNGDFYSDEINYRGYPFGTLPLRLSIVPVSHANGAIRAYPFAPSDPQDSGPAFSIRLQPDKGNSSVSRQTNMDGYRLNEWRLVMVSGAVEMQLFYTPIGWASLVKWLLPLAITMVVMLLRRPWKTQVDCARIGV
jgi:hypothetical protein